MALSEEEKKKMLSAFQEDTKKAEDEEYEDVWTDEAIIAVAHKILKRMGLDDKYL